MPEFVSLGRSGLKVTNLCLGTMNFGNEQWGCDEPTSAKIIDSFLAAGHNFIDTANVYAGGRSEEIVGRAIAPRRDEVVLATKGFNPDGPGPNERGNSRINLTRSLENSLRRLGTDYVDLYQCHAYDHSTPLDETMAALDSFVQQGKVRYIGCSNWLASNIVEAQAIAKIASSTPLVSLQPQYSLIVRDIEIDILSTCQRHGLGVIVWSPLGGGLLTGKHTKDKAAEGSRFGRVGEGDIWEMMKRALFTDRNFEIVDKVGEVAKSLGTTHTAVSVAWTVAQSGVTSAIIGPRSVEQLEDNLVAGEITLSDGQLKDLDRASRSPMTYAVFLQRGR